MSHALNRRTFLGFCAAGVSAGRMAPAAVGDSRQAGSAVRLHKAVKFAMITGNASPTEKLQLLADLGFDGTELAPGEQDVDEMIAAQKATGVRIHGVVAGGLWKRDQRLSAPTAEARAKGVAYLKNAIREAKRYGATTVLTIPGVVDEDNPYGEVYRRSRESLAKVIPLAEELDITLAMENVWNNFLLSPLEAARFVDDFKSKHVRWYFDVGNVVRSGWPEHWIEILGPRIAKLDIKEYDRKLQREQGLWKGFSAKIGDAEDGVNWPKVVAALGRIGFEGWATAEVPGGDRERLADIKARMDRALASPAN